jgi:hypothetical protein
MRKLSYAIIAILVFVAYVYSRKGEFHYERSGLINAPAEKIYPYLVSFKLGAQWNPYDQKDPNLKRVFSGADGQVGSAMDFDGNREGGAGRLELLQILPNQMAEIRLHMTRPISAENLILYRLTPEGTATRFSWAMAGDSGFLGKLVSVFIDCEKRVTKDFDQGIQNLKTVVEAQK